VAVAARTESYLGAPAVIAGWRRVLLLAAAVIGLDQLTKAIIRSSIPLGEHRTVIAGILDLTNTHNTGVAFGALAGGGAIGAALTGLALGALVVYFVLRVRTRHLWLPVGLLLGGALGNLIDRAWQGAVTDFIDPRLWPAFNVADACIVVGVLILLWVIEGASSSQTRS
jgi:signal peptidase II